MSTREVQEVFGRRASFYVDSGVHADRKVLAMVRELCGELRGRKVLDVATGTGHTAMPLSPQASMVVGLDMTREMLELAGRASVDSGLKNMHWLQGDVNLLPFLDQCFDVVSCRRAPHHFPDLGKAMKEMTRVLKEGGTMVIDDRSVPDDEKIDRTMNLLDRLHDPSHVREYGVGEWKIAIQEAGLNLRKIREYRRHLPLTSLTGNAEPEDAMEIERTVAALSSDLRRRMRIEEIGDQISIDHYFLTIRATK